MKLIQTVTFFFTLTACEGRRSMGMGISPSASRECTSSAAINKNAAIVNIRGGYSMTAKTAAATSIAVLNAVYGGSVMLTPSKVLKDAYKLPTVTDEEEFMAGHSGLSMVSGAMLIGSMLFTKTSQATALGSTVAVPMLLRTLCSLIVKHKSVGMGYFAMSAYMDTAVFAFCSYATLIKPSVSGIAMKLLGAWHLATGLLLFLYPSGYASVKSIAKDTPKDKGFATFFARNYGNNMLVAGIAFSALALGVDLILALGYGWMYGAVGIAIMNYVTKELPTYAPNAGGAVLFWIVTMGGLGVWATF